MQRRLPPRCPLRVLPRLRPQPDAVLLRLQHAVGHLGLQHEPLQPQPADQLQPRRRRGELPAGRWPLRVAGHGLPLGQRLHWRAGARGLRAVGAVAALLQVLARQLPARRQRRRLLPFPSLPPLPQPAGPAAVLLALPPPARARLALPATPLLPAARPTALRRLRRGAPLFWSLRRPHPPVRGRYGSLARRLHARRGFLHARALHAGLRRAGSAARLLQRGLRARGGVVFLPTATACRRLCF